MASNYYIKLWIETIDDPKMGRIPDNLWRRFFECCLLAGEKYPDLSGRLPSIPDIGWRLRIEEESLRAEFDQLARIGLLDYINAPLDEHWVVTNYAKRQARMDSAERMSRKRKRDKSGSYYNMSDNTCDAAVTPRNTDKIKIKEDKDKDSKISRPPVVDILRVWKNLFPSKPQPRATTKSLQAKIAARWKDQDFRENWELALETASKSETLNRESWFDFSFFVRNDTNYQKCLDGWMNWKDNAAAEEISNPVAIAGEWAP